MPWADQTLALLGRGYAWAPAVRAGRPAVRTTLLGRPAVLVGGPEGTRRFYAPSLQRHGAVPAPVRLVLFGPGAVHGLDGPDHHRRKQFLVDLLPARRVRALTAAAEEAWRRRIDAWRTQQEVCVHDEAVAVLGEAVLPWAGVTATGVELAVRARQLAAVVDGFGTPGPAYLRAAAARVQLDRWARALIMQVRAGRRQPPPGSTLAAVADAELGGAKLPVAIAATEFLNIVRPTVAVAWFITAAALLLHDHPEWRASIRSDGRVRWAVAQEIRRIVPFVPILAARARDDQEILGVPLRAGGLVILDVYGTNHDPDHWSDPEAFRPDRFLSTTVDPDTFVPQGGGSVTSGHRCPGEDPTMMMIMVAIRALSAVDYRLPGQDLFCPLGRVPTRPRSGVTITPRNVPAPAA